jgi:hypothetical protein
MTLRDIVIFLAGAQFFHTLSHIVLPYYVDLPLKMKSFEFTSTMNFWVIIINAIITLLLLWLASRLRKA